MDTRRALVGLIGANIQKSLSPALHEDAFAAAGMRGHYHLMDLDLLPGRTLADLLAAVRAAGFAGVNITIPCKEAVVPLLDEIAAEAREIGSVNTVTFDARGRALGSNTDRVGFRRNIEEAWGREAVARKTVLLVGAGGAGRAVAFALLDLGAARVLLHDRDGGRAASLASALRSKFGAERCEVPAGISHAIGSATVVVNATPVGMAGFPGLPISVDALQPGYCVADVVYTPLETELIKAARAKGARVATGGGMCIHQAAEAFRQWTGIAPDLTRMKRVFAEAAAARDGVLSGGPSGA